MEQVVLVDNEGHATGLMEKIKAHEQGLLHKAFSVLLWNASGEMLLQQRSDSKYHWPGIWSNACCSHPREHETSLEAANRRLKEELGINCKLQFLFSFVYKATDEQTGLIEHEHDDVFVGRYAEEIPFNLDEVKAVKWIAMNELYKEIDDNPSQYSFWFKRILEEIKDKPLPF